MSLAHKLAFYPSLLYGITLEKLGLRTWYTRIDEYCVIGALPLYNNYKYIVEKENIKGVVTLNEDYELKYSPTTKEWNELGVEHLRIPVRDYHEVATLEQIIKAIEFINDIKNKTNEKSTTTTTNSIYVHCKAGRYRSALICSCYLIHKYKHEEKTINDVINLMKELRPYVILNSKRQFNAMFNYRNYLLNNKNK